MLAQLVGLASMMACTWRLWFPLIGQSDGTPLPFPQIPVLPSLVNVSPWWSWGIGIGIALTLQLVVLGLCLPKFKCSSLLRVLAGVLALLLTVSVFCNQHRFLPWVWQSQILLMLLVFYWNRSGVLGLARWLAISIYLYSAVAKLDYQFVMTTGRQIFETMIGFVGLDSSGWSPTLVSILVLSFPLGELAVGFGLMLKKTRRLATVAAMLMHALLFLVLGPWGMDNAPTVLIWNLQFLIQAPVLFWGDSNSDPVRTVEPGRIRWRSLQGIIVALFFAVPMFERIEMVDHWPAWGLYSPRASRARLWVIADRVEQFPAEIRSCFRQVESSSPRGIPVPMRELDLAKWSIQTLNAPVYPQDRFQLGVILYLVDRLGLERDYRIELQSAANSLTGRREIKVLTDRYQILQTLDRFWVNGRPSE